MATPSQLLHPRYWGQHLLGIVAVSIAVGMGMWQLNAWQERRAAEALDLTRIAPEPITDVIGSDDPFPADKVGQPVVVSGTWLPESTLLISNRTVDGVEGYWVTTPISVGAPDAPALVVVRGWTADATDVPPAPQGTGEFVVWLQPSEGTGAVDDDTTDDVLPQLRIADVLNHVDRDLYGAYGVVADKVAEGDWPVGETAVNDGTATLAQASLEQLPATSGTTALKNLLYAIEWWVFGAFAAFIWWRWIRDELDADLPGADQGGDGETPLTPAGASPASVTNGSIDSQA